jgi:hypothetical protein
MTWLELFLAEQKTDRGIDRELLAVTREVAASARAEADAATEAAIERSRSAKDTATLNAAAKLLAEEAETRRKRRKRAG